MTEMTDEEKKAVKQIIKQLQAGASPEEVKGKFKEVLGRIDFAEIAKAEEKLLKEGVEIGAGQKSEDAPSSEKRTHSE